MFVWCRKCERTYSRSLWRKCAWSCPNRGCTGNVVDSYPWSPDSLPRRNNPLYPEKPIKGKRYPLNAGTVDLSFGLDLLKREDNIE